MKMCYFCDIFVNSVHTRCILPKLGKFIYDNICHSAQNRSKKGTRKWFQRCSGGKACSELSHLLQRQNRVFI